MKHLMFFSLQLEGKLPNNGFHHPAWETQVRATCLDYLAAEEGAGFNQQAVQQRITIEVHSTGVLYLCIPSWKASGNIYKTILFDT